MYLNTPVLALPVARRQAPGPALRSFHPLASSLPCDFHLLNLRTLQAEVSVRFSTGSPEQTLPLLTQTPLHPTLPSWQWCCPTCEPCRDPSPPPPTHTHTHTCAALCVCHQEDGLPSGETALLLHRKGFDCGLEAKNLGFNCTTSQGKVSRAPVWEGSRGQGNRAPGTVGRELGEAGSQWGGGQRYSRTSWREGEEAGDVFSKPLRPGRGWFQTRCPGRKCWFHVYEPALNKQKHQELKTKSHHTVVIV